MADYSIGGLNSLSYHIQNIFWHILAILAFFYILKKFNINILLAFMICLIYAIHPQRVESVVWLSQRKDVLCSAFYLWSIFFYIKNRPKISFILFVCAILSKPMAITLPFILCLYEYYKIKNFHFYYYFKKLYPFLIIICIFLPITYLSQGKAVNINVPLWERFLSVSYNILWYIKQTIIPQNLNPIYPQFFFIKNIFISFLSSAATLLFLIYLYFKFKEKFLMIFLSYLFALFPISGIVKLGFTDMADRYSYIPSAFIWFGLSLIIMKFMNDNSSIIFKRLVVILLLLAAIIYGLTNYKYQQNWKTPTTLADKACSYKSVSPLALKTRAGIAISSKDYKTAHLIAEDFLKLNNINIIYYNSIYCYISAVTIKMKIAFDYNDPVKALKYFNLIRNYIQELDPWYKNYLLTGIACYQRLGNNIKSAKILNKILKLKNLSKFEKFYYRGLKEFYIKNYNKSLIYFEKAQKIDSENKDVLHNIMICKKMLNEKVK
ncbi:MAG TPA: hypothetical protein QF753_03190 [Victivallales bacterium]|nr:hypothetical protein [Victivallales bacterium]